MAVKIFVDFDGTVTRQDVGNAFFETFGGQGYKDILKEYEAERLSAQDTFRWGIKAIGIVNTNDVDEFVRRQPIDETFKEFCDFCRAHGVEFHVVSDGLDYYIRRVLAAHGVSGVSFFSNVVEVVPVDGNRSSFVISFPYSDAECSRCACCKRNIMLTQCGDDDIIVYVGEGYSDRCAAQYADVVFAKDALQTFCQQENISYYPYSSFHDVVERMKVLLTRKLRKRRRAELRRREAFTCE